MLCTQPQIKILAKRKIARLHASIFPEGTAEEQFFKLLQPYLDLTIRLFLFYLFIFIILIFIIVIVLLITQTTTHTTQRTLPHKKNKPFD